jgi:hypothetical protein
LNAALAAREPGPAVTDVVSPSTLNAKVKGKEIRTPRVAPPADAL